MEDWENKRIGIYKATISAFGQTQECLRVRDYPPRVAEEFCEECGQKITAHGDYTVNKIAVMTESKYGRKLCWDCATNEKKKLEETD